MFQLQNRYQDSGWDNLPGEEFHHSEPAVSRAGELSKDAIWYGMVRVIDTVKKEVVKTFAAGGTPCKS